MLYDLLISGHTDKKKIILSDTSKSLSYSEIDDLCIKIRSVFMQYGLNPGDRILIYAERKLSVAVIILACISMGICFIPVPPGISEECVSEIIQSSEPVMIIGNICTQADVRSVSFDNLMCMAKNTVVQTIPSAVADPIVYILYTSGSTGTPKGVVAEESSVEFCIHAINERLQNTSNDRILCCLPLSFDYGLYQIFLALSSGACLVIPPEMPFQKIVTFLAKERITGFPAMPSMLNMLLRTRLLQKVDLSSIRYITSTGDVFPVSLIQNLKEVIPSAEVLPMYGLTECKRVSIMPIGRYDKVLAGSCGLPLDDVKVWLEDVDSNGIGELVIKGKNVMSGYWHNSDAAEQCYFLDDTGQRCLRSGDLFKIDEDGFLYFISRKKDILKVNGYRIGVAELENRLYSAMNDLVDEIGVFGYPDAVAGEKIAVFIATVNPTDQINERLKTVSRNLSSYSRPHLLYCTAKPLPKNINGKIDRKKLVEMGLQLDYVKLR